MNVFTAFRVIFVRNISSFISVQPWGQASDLQNELEKRERALRTLAEEPRSDVNGRAADRLTLPAPRSECKNPIKMKCRLAGLELQ